MFTSLPITYVALKAGLSLPMVVGIKLLINASTLIFRIFYLQRTINLNASKYFKDVLFKAFYVTLLSFPIPYVINKQMTGWTGLITTLSVSFVISVLVIYFIGLNKNEKKLLLNTINNFLKRIK